LYYIIFFNNDYNIVKAHKTEEYPTVGNLVYLFKLLEVLKESDLGCLVEELKMDIITEEEFNIITEEAQEAQETNLKEEK
jgi:hypothetical protein